MFCKQGLVREWRVVDLFVVTPSRSSKSASVLFRISHGAIPAEIAACRRLARADTRETRFESTVAGTECSLWMSSRFDPNTETKI